MSRSSKRRKLAKQRTAAAAETLFPSLSPPGQETRGEMQMMTRAVASGRLSDAQKEEIYARFMALLKKAAGQEEKFSRTITKSIEIMQRDRLINLKEAEIDDGPRESPRLQVNIQNNVGGTPTPQLRLEEMSDDDLLRIAAVHSADALGGGNGTAAQAPGTAEPTGLHHVHESRLPHELAPPDSSGCPDAGGDGRLEATNDLRGAADREVGIS